MKKALEFFKQHKNVMIVAILLAVLIIVAVVLFGKKPQSVITGNVTEAKSATEIKLINILSEIEGVGQTEVMINENAEGEVEGVIIVCSGADNIMTRNDVLNVVTTALNVNKNNIAIYAMK